MSSGRTVFLGLLLALVVAAEAAGRRKRELRFPKGSSLSNKFFPQTAVALTSYLPKGITDGFAHVLEFDFGFPFPEQFAFGKSDSKRKSWEKSKHATRIVKRDAEDEERRKLLYKIEKAINRVGVNGTACVFRFRCELQQVVPEGSLLEEFLVALFRTSDGLREETCEGSSGGCPISLLHVVLHSQQIPPLAS